MANFHGSSAPGSCGVCVVVGRVDTETMSERLCHRRKVIKLANKRNLSLRSGACWSTTLLSLLLASTLLAQVPPRPGVVGQREE